MVSYSVFNHDVEPHHFKIVEPISKDYKVCVNGQEIPVYTCRVSKHPFNRLFPGYQRSVDQTEFASFVNIVSDEPVNVTVTPCCEYEKVMIRPAAYNIIPEQSNGDFSFFLESDRQVVFATDDFHNCLFIFNSLPIKPPVLLPTYYFGPGIHVAGKIVLKDNESIYIDKDALVYGCVFAQNAKNISITGNGIFDDSSEARFTRCGYEDYVNGNIKLVDCQNVNIKGVLFRDSAIWCVNIFRCKNVVADGIKVFGQWRYNTDGFDIVNSNDVTLKNSFIHSFDDTVVVKGIDRYFDTDNKNIFVENCVLWCDWGKAIELGIETSCRRYQNINFSNCHILRAGNTALDIHNGDFAEISNVNYSNITVELNAFDEIPVYQHNDEMVYPSCDESMIAKVISIKNYRYREGLWGDQYENSGEFDTSGIQVASVHDIQFENIFVYYDENLPPLNDFSQLIDIIPDVGNEPFYDIEIKNFGVSGLKNENIKYDSPKSSDNSH